MEKLTKEMKEYRMRSERLKRRKAEIRNAVLSKHDKATKIKYLEGMGLFEENVLNEMDEKQITELVNTAMQVKGF